MFEFFKKKKKINEKEDTTKKIGTGIAIETSVETSKMKLGKIFSKSKTYNRDLYDSNKARVEIKDSAFLEGEYRDPYTGKILESTMAEAKAKYGDKWMEHFAESDHTVPIKNLYEKYKTDPWLKNEDIKDIANSKDNMKVLSRKLNNAKRAKTNEEFFNDKEYLEQTEVEISEEARARAIKDGKDTQKILDKGLKIRKFKNIVSSGHEAGKYGAKNAGEITAVISGYYNIVAVISGEKNVEEALKDISVDTTKSMGIGYVTGGGLSVVSHTLASAESKFLKALAKSNVPAKVITAVMVTGNTLKKYADGKISTQECLLELGEKGLNVATAGYSMAVGQALIPIPVVGAAVGALVGSALTTKYYESIVGELRIRELEHKKRLALIAEAKQAEKEAIKFREELEEYLDRYFYDYKDCFDEALFEIKSAFQRGDVDAIISGANKITRKLDGKVYYENIKEFKEFLDSNETDIL